MHVTAKTGMMDSMQDKMRTVLRKGGGLCLFPFWRTRCSVPFRRSLLPIWRRRGSPFFWPIWTIPSPPTACPSRRRASGPGSESFERRGCVCSSSPTIESPSGQCAMRSPWASPISATRASRGRPLLPCHGADGCIGGRDRHRGGSDFYRHPGREAGRCAHPSGGAHPPGGKSRPLSALCRRVALPRPGQAKEQMI